MVLYAGSSVPSGYLNCDGSAVSRTTYAALFTAIGTTWGAGDGSTTFNLPNMVGKFAYGGNTPATTATTSDSANIDHAHNASSGNQSANHTHTVTASAANESADHAHNWSANTGNASNDHTHNVGVYYNGGNPNTKTTSGVSASHYHGVSGTTSGITANHNHAINTSVGNNSANHSHAITVASTSGLAHSHGIQSARFIYIIKATA